MAATGKTPILLYGSTTTTNTPSAANLTNSSEGCEIAINVADKNLFFKDATNVVNTVPIRQSSASSNGWLSSTDWSTFNGKAPAFTYTTGYIPFGQGTTTPTQDAALFWDNTNKRLGAGTSTPTARLDITGSSFATANVNFAQRTDDTTVSTATTWSTSTSNWMMRNVGGVLTIYSGNTIGSSVGTERLNFATTGDVTFKTGNVVIGTSGKGIDFSATAGTGTSELLADYEEGTWTPTPSGLTTTGTPLYTGTYTKVGRQVFCTLVINANGGTTASTAGTTYFSGLPYAVSVPVAVPVADAFPRALTNGYLATSGNLLAPTWAAWSYGVYFSFTYTV